MAYADLTFNDKNKVKAWLQRQRLVKALQFSGAPENPQTILDFGAGNGELCKHVVECYPLAKVVCYEPTPCLLAEAQENLSGLSQIEFRSDVYDIPQGSVDLLFCLEVFEHLPKNQTSDALSQIHHLLRNNGLAIIDVPVEVGLPALYKGIFRMFRRFGAFDALPKNILRATLGIPLKNHPLSEITSGFDFHYSHMGFDHRQLIKLLRSHFKLQQTYSSPFAVFGSWINSEIYFVVKKENL